MIGCWRTVVLVLALATLARAEADRLPAPTGAALATARQQVRESYRDDFKNAQLPKARSLLAATLVSAANKGTRDPDQRYAMLAEAMDLYRDAGDLAGAMKVADDMTKAFAVDAAGLKLSLVKSTPKAALMGVPKSTVQTLSPLVEQCIAADKYAEAKEIADLCLAAAKATGERELVQQQTDLQQDAEQIQRNFNTLAPTLATLKEKPTDPAANLRYGRFLCFMKGDWDKGLPCLVAGPDASLRTLAQRELVESSQATAMLEKGDAMWRFGDSQSGLTRRRVRQRAAFWYQQSLPELTGADKDRVKTRLAEIPGVAAKKSGFDPVGTWIKNTGTQFVFNSDGTLESNGGETSFYKHGKWTTEGQKLTLTFGKQAIQLDVINNDELVEPVGRNDAWVLRRAMTAK
jgi:hypothetical protein